MRKIIRRIILRLPMRAIWSGAVSFGLIHIPVKLYAAAEDKGPDLDMLRRQDLCPIRYARGP